MGWLAQKARHEFSANQAQKKEVFWLVSSIFPRFAPATYIFSVFWLAWQIACV